MSDAVPIDRPAGVAFLIPTIARPACLERLVLSIRQFHPASPILVIDQDGAVADFCREQGVDHHRIADDAGVSVARNIGVARMTYPHFVLCDDDWVLTRPLDLDTAIRFLDAHPDVSMVGGPVDEPHKPQRVRDSIVFDKARNFAIDRTARGVILISAHFAGSPSVTFDGETFLYCDMLASWGLCATDRFRAHDLTWDEHLKTGIEHLDFFLTIALTKPHVKMAYWDRFACRHQPERDVAYRALRYRLDWTAYFAAKWNLRYQFNAGGGLRLYDETFATGHDAGSHDAGTERLQTALDASNERNGRLKAQLANLQAANARLRASLDRLRLERAGDA